MTTNVIPMFAYGAQQLRGVMIDGQPWFHATDACRCLGMDTSKGTHRWLAGLDSDEKRVLTRDFAPQVLCGPKDRMAAFISRPGLFKLIQRSSKPEAKAFDRWVRHEVLPQIMDNGGYMTKDADVKGSGVFATPGGQGGRGG